MDNHNDQTQAPVVTADPAPQAYPPTMEGYAQGPYVMPPPIYPMKDGQHQPPEGNYHRGEETTTRGGGRGGCIDCITELICCFCDDCAEDNTTPPQATNYA